MDSTKIANGQANTIHILYKSRIFPSLMLTGFFDPQTVVNFTDDSSNPFQVNSWSATFTIYSTTPALNKSSDLQKSFEDEFKSDPFNAVLKEEGQFSGPPDDRRLAQIGSTA